MHLLYKTIVSRREDEVRHQPLWLILDTEYWILVRNKYLFFYSTCFDLIYGITYFDFFILICLTCTMHDSYFTVSYVQFVIDQVTKLDLKRTFVFTSLGLVLVGPTLHFW